MLLWYGSAADKRGRLVYGWFPAPSGDWVKRHLRALWRSNYDGRPGLRLRYTVRPAWAEEVEWLKAIMQQGGG